MTDDKTSYSESYSDGDSSQEQDDVGKGLSDCNDTDIAVNGNDKT